MEAIETTHETTGVHFEATADGHGNVGFNGYMIKGNADSNFALGYVSRKDLSCNKMLAWDLTNATVSAIIDSFWFKNEFKYRFNGYQNGWMANHRADGRPNTYMVDSAWVTCLYPSGVVYKGPNSSGQNWEKWQQPSGYGSYMGGVERMMRVGNSYDTLWYHNPAKCAGLDDSVRHYLGWMIDYARNSYAPIWLFSEYGALVNMDGGDYTAHWADQVHFIDSLLSDRSVIYAPRMWQDRYAKYRNWISIANYQCGSDYVKFTMRDTSSILFGGSGYNWYKNLDGTRTIPVNLTYEVARINNEGNYEYETVIVPQFVDSLVCYSIYRAEERRWYHSPGRKLSSGMITKSSSLFGDPSLTDRGYYSGWF